MAIRSELTVTSTLVVGLDSADARSAEVVGAKAARLAELTGAGFTVPSGRAIPAVVVGAGDPALLRQAAGEALDALGDGPLAVRSSALAEDLPDASFAGLYESVLDVQGEAALLAAIEQVAASAEAERVATYRHDEAAPVDPAPAATIARLRSGAEQRNRPDQDPERATPEAAQACIAVLVQQMVPADCAGVAFTADPLTGDRDVVVLSAVRGVGERLVSGEAAGEQWRVGDAGAVGPRDTPASVLRADQAEAVADLARRVEAHYGPPQDIEWAFAGGDLYLLQARPMTALAEVVTWDPPVKGHWRRDFRFAEWLPEPVTPLFDTWFFAEMGNGFEAFVKGYWGGGPTAPFHVLVNGWCYMGLGQMGPSTLLGVVHHPVRTVKWGIAFSRTGKDPARGERDMAAPALAVFRDEIVPRYRERVAHAEAGVATADSAALVELVDRLSQSVGEILYPLADTLGFAWKSELALATLYGDRLQALVGGSHQTLLAGLIEPADPPAHAVTSFDWMRPTLGESGGSGGAPTAERYAALVEAREAATAACREALVDQPHELARFNQFLDIAQRYAVVREEIASTVTLGWPAMRQAILRLGGTLADAGVLGQADDAFWLTRDELTAALGGDHTPRRSEVAERRALWARQRRLSPPTVVGKASKAHDQIGARAEAFRSAAADLDDGAIVGMPASPGRAVGPARVVVGPDDFDRVQPGDVLVAPATAPAWTPLFGRIAAVVTDGGSVVAHASLIAREYAIPAVVSTGDATTKLRDGDLVTVDGNVGTVSFV